MAGNTTAEPGLVTPPSQSRFEALRTALTNKNTEDWHTLDSILADADEKERAAIMRALGGFAAVYEAEGPTLRMVYLRAAVARRDHVTYPKGLFAHSTGQEATDDRWVKHHPDPGYPLYPQESFHTDAAARQKAGEAFAAGIMSRGGTWVNKVFEDIHWCHDLWSLHIMRRLMRDVPPEQYHPEYLREIRYYLCRPFQDEPFTRESHAERIVRILTEDEGLREKEFWAFFTAEGMGDTQAILTSSTGTRAGDAQENQLLESQLMAAFDSLCARLPGFRDRLLDATLTGMLSDFSARHIAWYLNIQKHLAPTVGEILARKDNYLSLLSTEPGAAVAWGQAAYKTLLAEGALDNPYELISASGAVLSRADKKSIKAQLSLLRTLNNYANKHDYLEVPQKVSELVRGSLPSYPADIAQSAQKLILEKPSGEVPNHTQSSCQAAPRGAEIPHILAPRTVPLPDNYASGEPITAPVELNRLLTEHLSEASGETHGMGAGEELARILDGIITLGAEAIDKQNRELMRRTIREIQDIHTPEANWSVSSWGFLCRYNVILGLALAELAEVKDNDGTLWQELIATITGGTMAITRHARLENRRVSLLLIFEMMRFIDEMRSGSAAAPFMRPIPAQSRPWRRIHYPQSHLGMLWDSTRDEQELPIWEAPMMTEEQGVGAMQSAALGGPCTRIDGSCDMYEREEWTHTQHVPEWFAWLMQNNPDTYAAHSHIRLMRALTQNRVPEVQRTMRLLEASRQVPTAPVYSALALACSAKSVENRAAAAEAIAGLCASNLFDPAGFAHQVRLLLAEKLLTAGRLAKTLEDAAHMSALSGYRVLHVLAELLNETKPAHQLLDLLGKLCVHYGVAVPVPEHLIPAPKARGVAVSALRTIAAVEPHATDALIAAADEAAAAEA